MYCRKCGHPILAGDRFCGGCGAAVEEERPEQGIRTGETIQTEEVGEMKEEVIYNSPDQIAGETVPPAQGQKISLIFDDPGESDDYITSTSMSKSEPELAGSVKPPIVLGGGGETAGEPENTEIPIDFSEFSWNVQDFPKPKKVEEIEFRWHDPDKVDITLRDMQTPEKSTAGAPEPQVEPKPTASVRKENVLEYETEPDISYDVTSMLANETPAEKEARIRELEAEIFGEALSAAPEEKAAVPEPAEKAAAPAPTAAPVTEPMAADPTPTSTATLGTGASDSAVRPAKEPVIEPIPFEEPEVEVRPQPILTEDPSPSEETSLFKEMEEPVADAIGDDDIERFFTFSKKNEEFQKLLDREYEKIQKRDAAQGGPKEAASAPIAVPLKPPVDETDPVLARDTKPVELRKIMERQPENPAPVTVSEPIPQAAEPAVNPSPQAVEPAVNPIPQAAAEPQSTILPSAAVEGKASAAPDAAGEVRSGRVVGFSSAQLDEMEAARASFFGSTVSLDQETISDQAGKSSSNAEPDVDLKALEKEIFGDAISEDPAGTTVEEQYDAPRVEVVSPVIPPVPQTEAAAESGGGLYEIRTDDSSLGRTRETEKKRLGTVGIVILAIVIAILAIEAAMLGIKYFAPQSPAAVFVEKVQSGIMGIFHKDQAPVDDPEKPTATIEELIYRQRGNNYGEDNGNIREIRENSDLKFDPSLDYGVPDLNASTPITDNYWLTDANGIVYNYDATSVGTVIAFDSRWVEYMNTGDNAVFNFLKSGTGAYEKAMAFEEAGKMNATFKLLEIGEIRQGTTGFYVWTHELISVTEDGVETPEENYRIYYVEPDGSAFRVIDYYAFNQ